MKKKVLSKGMRACLHMLQHIAIVTTAIAVLLVMTGSTVMIRGVDGNYSYSMDADEKGKDYKESLLFNHIFGRGVADVARMAAVQSQMETDGAFDGSKETDVTTFYYRYEKLPDQYVTAKYRLEDLIKWAQYGFEQEEQFMTGEEVDQFLNRTTTFTGLQYGEDGYNGGIVSPFNSNLEEFTQNISVSANDESTDGFKRDEATAIIMKNRYTTTDNKLIEELTGTWEDYYELCEYVKTAATDLNKNYQEYLKYKEFYTAPNSNLRFYIIKTIGERQEVYTNLSDRNLTKEELDIKFQGIGKYMHFNPGQMKFETNTLLEEETVRHIFNGYEYAYPEDTQVWIGVDTSFAANDVYIQGMHGYTGYAPYYYQLLGLAAASFVLYVLLLMYLTVKEGRVKAAELSTSPAEAEAVWTDGRDKTETETIAIKCRFIDTIPTELMVLAAVLIVGGIIVALTYVFDSMSYEYYYTTWFKVAAGFIVLVCELLFSLFYYSFVRRLKADTLWKHSLTCIGLKKGRSCVWSLYDNGSIIRKTWIPYLIFLIVNLLLVVWDVKGIILAACVDVVLGVLIYRNAKDRVKILESIEKIKEGDLKYKIDEKDLHGDNLILAQAVNNIGEGIRIAVETSMKDERLKADLITNVSHDIKTPLTSIINYVDLIRRENIENQKVKGYIEVLDAKSQRLKQLTDDLVEASKISSGNIALEWERINLVELVNQTLGEFSEKFEQKKLTPVINNTSAAFYIEADSRRIWRVVENLFNNIFKYALEGTRVYMDMMESKNREGKLFVEFSIKNISAQPLNINADELTERFIRGDVARSTEGSGLGLSIAKNLTEAQKGTFEILLDGDLFKIVLTFPLLSVKGDSRAIIMQDTDE